QTGRGRMPVPLLEGPGVGRFMESLLALLRVHWDHEPRRGGRRRAYVLDCGSPLPLLRPRTRSESARGLAHSKTSRRAGWFMERGSPPEMGIGAVGSDVHVPKLTPLHVSVEEEQVAAAGLIPLEMGRVVLFRPASLNAGVTV